ncbi:hypothetical protein Acel_2069 [Acidothermus cellulolyticus 11B]|uniref:Uncharacterized protein n=1 Tax=Acidothermus cellulolyticus (strain ATCC 43068 / DSM 8971 / 11B) TaxID=351607 RepID=A0LWN1_ACIC1|nr:hypothetical protein Acel_2069 [Acidothermus cellulolyticus 11B]
MEVACDVGARPEPARADHFPSRFPPIVITWWARACWSRWSRGMRRHLRAVTRRCLDTLVWYVSIVRSSSSDGGVVSGFG